MLITVDDNIVLVGTAHISKESIREVKRVIEEYKPKIVAVELCQKRYEALVEKDKWENTPITSLLRSNKAYLILVQTFLSSIQRRLGKDFGVEPGSEMITAIREAEKRGLKVALVDRDIAVTLKRAWRKMGIREKIRLSWEFLKALVGYDEELDQVDLKELMKQDVISTMMKEFGEIAPSVTSVLIHERDQYIAKKILEESHKGRVVAVVGAGHLEGIKTYLEEKRLNAIDLQELDEVPRKRFNVMKTLAYLVPIIFAALIIYIVTTGSWERAAGALLWWFVINGSLSAVGALIARGHPFSILTAFAVAPLTSLNPALAAGWFAGLVEAKMRTPAVKDFQGLSRIDSIKGFLNNKVIRVLMVVALANVGSMIGTFVALYYISRVALGG